MPMTFCEWGSQGARTFDRNVGAMVVVDVLSFSTCIDIAVARGAVVVPFRFHDETAAAELARALGADVAGARGSGKHRFSLSPASLTSIEPGNRLVLPSPNGSSISATARAAPVLAGCLRNARAVAMRAKEIAQGCPIAVIPAGERWPDGSLRPAIEDLIGAGAIIDELGLPCTPEAEVARGAFLGARADLDRLLSECVSGRELIDRGFAQDVAIAAAINSSQTAPRLINGAFSA